jgi:DNA-binding response OmpR family regulator
MNQPQSQDGNRPQNGEPKPVALVIEDDPQLVTIFAMAMQTAGFETVTAVDGRIALEKLAQMTPDLILLDVHLPHVSGDDILRHIRADERLKNATVVLSTADSRVAAQLREEASLVLLKPISFKELVELAKSLR